VAGVSLTERIARTCARRPGVTFAAWGVALAAAIVALAFVLTGLTTEPKLTNEPESVRAERALVRLEPPGRSSERIFTDYVVIRSETRDVDDPGFRTFVEGVVARGREARAALDAMTFYETNNEALVSRDRHATLVPMFVPDEEAAGKVIEIAESAGAEYSVTVTGNQTFDHDFNVLSERDLREGELQFGLPAALIILVLVFGALVAGVIPLLMAGASILTALGLVALLSLQFDLSIFIVNMLTGMGLALGIDYSLFVISRYREERAAGRGQHNAIGAAGATASRAVLFSGSAFVVAMFGMLLVPASIMRSLAAGAILVGATSVLAAMTLLPALLGVLGDRVNALRIPVVGRRSLEASNPEGRFWRRVIDAVLRRPALSLATTTALLVLAAVPVLGLNIGAAGISTLPDDLASKRGYLALQRDFPNQSVDPVFVVGPADELRRLQTEFADDPRFGGRGRLDLHGREAVLRLPLRGDEVSDAAVSAVRELRSQTNALVGGATAEQVDYFAAVTDPAPYVFAFVLGLTLVLLTIAFRSIAVAATAIFLNLLSVGAAYGLLVLVFQEGVGNEIFGFRQVDVIEAWVPLFLFSVLFGLSMDYQVFLLSRIRERYDRTRETRDAVGWGVASTARIITGAALIIVAVFAGFARGDLVMFQQMGFGVAVSLLIDATLIRSVLLPSLMALLGERNWYLPRWLSWLPHLEVEGRAAAETR
jgi:RND superfamily putative drug exporter